MKWKKGEITSDNFLGTVLAVLVVLLFVSAAYGGVKAVYKNSEQKNAESITKEVQAKIIEFSKIDKTSLNDSIAQVSNENVWYLAVWSEDEIGRPDKCFFDSCVCICPERSNVSCQDNGHCLLLKETKIIKTEDFYAEEIYGFANLRSEFPTPTGKYRKIISKFIPLEKIFTEVVFEKNSDDIKIIHYSEEYLKNKGRITE